MPDGSFEKPLLSSTPGPRRLFLVSFFLWGVGIHAARSLTVKLKCKRGERQQPVPRGAWRFYLRSAVTIGSSAFGSHPLVQGAGVRSSSWSCSSVNSIIHCSSFVNLLWGPDHGSDLAARARERRGHQHCRGLDVCDDGRVLQRLILAARPMLCQSGEQLLTVWDRTCFQGHGDSLLGAQIALRPRSSPRSGAAERCYLE